ncbi:hypothetical protein HHI36_013500 [Cryptolaemus montrouzieri]|uniref:BTB domain-containing protein n=1 Tax=Cryptolaemus montrouzieri TaxID=559131 RepID=A0ABD2NIE9_9CUCU
MENPEEEIDSSEEIMLIIDDVEIVCNKQLLLDNSDYFTAMLTGNFVEKHSRTVNLQGVVGQAMQDLIRLLTNELSIDECPDIFAVLAACNMFLFEGLKSAIILQLEEKLLPSNCLRIWFECENLQIYPLATKAKSICLRDFREVKQNSTISQLNLSELCTYLGHTNLHCDNELSVFQTAMSWFRNHSDEEQDVVLTLIKLLACIDFKHAAMSEILEIKSCSDLQNFPEILLILDGIIKLRSGDKLVENENNGNHLYNECCQIAQSFMQSKRRYFPKNPYFLMRNSKKFKLADFEVPVYEIICYDPVTQYLKRFADLDLKKLSSLNGFCMLEYKKKIYLFGGEYSMGKGSWNQDVWSLDIIEGTKEQKQSMPAPRRHFESCVCGNYIYVVGGTGAYRVIQDNINWYDLEGDTWSKGAVLPCSGKQIKCCCHNNQLFVFSLSEKCGYLFFHETGLWKKFEISDPNCFIPKVFTPFSIISYNNNLYLKGDKLIQLVLMEDKLNAVKISPLPCYHDGEFVESVASDNIVYTLYKHKGEENDKLCLECLNLETLVIKFLCQSISDPKDTGKIDDFSFDATIKLFMFHHYDLVAHSIEVNDKEAIHAFELARLNQEDQ